LPISAGDDVLLIVADRSIDTWREFGKVQNPHEPVELRHNDITDSLAIIGATPNPRALSGYITNGIDIRNKAGDTRVRVLNDSVEVTNSGGASITLNSDGTITIDSPSKITQCAPLLEWITDDINVTPKSGTDVAANMKNLTLCVKDIETASVPSYNVHTHSGVQPGGGNSDIPNP